MVAFRALGLLAMVVPLAAQKEQEIIGCTAIGVDGAASADGSAFAGMTADSGAADYRLTFNPPRKHLPGAMRPVYTFNLSYPRFVGYGRSPMYHPESPDAPLYEAVGSIPEVESTFGYYEAAEPLINDQGLGFGESSCGAMLVNKFPDATADTRDVPVGMLDTVTMMQLPLERCATARCAVELMGKLAEEFGFVPTPGEPNKGNMHGRIAWDDGGEAYTIADKLGEAWVFHVVGGVSGVTKSVWAAQRIPKGHVAVIPNEFIIGDVPDEPTDDFLYGKDTFKAALASGLWDGKGRLHWSRAFAPNPLLLSTPDGAVPIPLYGAMRKWAVYNLAAPSLKLPFTANQQDLPFSVKVEKEAISHRDVMGYFRTQYEGTEFDMTKGMLAGPYGNPFRVEGGPKSGQTPRGISIPRTLYGIIAHTGPKESLGWFAHDTPTTAVYVPLYAHAGGAVSPLFENCKQSEFSRGCSAWAFNFVSNWMQLNYDAMSKNDVYPAIEKWQDTIDQERQGAESWDPEVLHQWQLSLQERVIADWWKLSDFLVMKYNDGKTNYPKVGVSWGYPEWYAEAVGFSNDIHPRWCEATSEPPPEVAKHLVGYVEAVTSLPLIWNDAPTYSWSWTHPGHALSLAQAATTSQGAQILLAMFASMAFGVVAGRTFERRRSVKTVATYEPLL